MEYFVAVIGIFVALAVLVLIVSVVVAAGGDVEPGSGLSRSGGDGGSWSAGGGSSPFSCAGGSSERRFVVWQLLLVLRGHRRGLRRRAGGS